jgi:hypothetical protein
VTGPIHVGVGLARRGELRWVHLLRQ